MRTALLPAPSLLTRRSVPEGIRITKVGLWYIVLTILVAVPAANTGNNALYLVEAFLLALLVVSGVASRQNLRRLDLGFEPPAEIYAKQPFSIRYTIHNRGRFMSRRLLVVAGVGEGKPTLIPHIPIQGTDRGLMEVQVEHRGIHQVPYLHFSSIFPLGLFRKGLRYRIDRQLLVYPEVDTTRSVSVEQLGGEGELPSTDAGAGYDLLSLRLFREGDDRRGIHWKQTARTGNLIFMERAADTGRRLSIQLDNAVGDLADPEDILRFERLVSRAATATHHCLKSDYEVELITRSGLVPFGRGGFHRRRILEHLALLETVPRQRDPLVDSNLAAPRLRLHMESEP
ncbi:MAG: DUF58 domain-containing protein [Thermoanaerobaculia bacterium]